MTNKINQLNGGGRHHRNQTPLLMKTILKIKLALAALLAVACVTFLPATARSGDCNSSIVGLWRVHFLLDNGTEFFQSFKQFHPDRLEYENASFPGASCGGIFKVRADGTVELLHVFWLFDQNGQFIGFARETDIIRVGPSGDHYSGTWHEKDFDLNGNLVGELKGTVHATRLTVQ